MSTRIEQILGADHREIDRLLDGAISALNGPDMGEAFTRLDLFWARLAVHIRAEHLHLFPAVLKQARSLRDPEDLEATVTALKHDHDIFMRTLADGIKKLRLVLASRAGHETVAGVREAVNSLRRRLAEHNRAEEEYVYAIDLGAARNETDVDLAGSIVRELNNLPPRLRST